MNTRKKIISIFKSEIRGKYIALLAILLICISFGIMVKNTDTSSDIPAESTEFITDTEEVETISDLQVHFIDVGQGDSTLIICGSEAMSIDAGDDAQGTKVQNYLQKQGGHLVKICNRYASRF